MNELWVLDLCAGSGMLGRAAAAVVARESETVRFDAVENDESAGAVLAARGHRVVGEDIRDGLPFGTTYDVVVGGTPCQGFSVTGKRTGAHGPSGLVIDFLDRVHELGPRVVVWENVAAASARQVGFPDGVVEFVVGELSRMGYRAEAVKLSASAIGFCHVRARWFVVGVSSEVPLPALRQVFGPITPPDRPAAGWVRTPAASDATRRGVPAAPQYQCTTPQRTRHLNDQISACGGLDRWLTRYGSLLDRHGFAVDRPHPPIVEDSRLTPQFYEWMMGWPEDWTAADGVTENDRVRMCGNGVVPQQAATAIRMGMLRIEYGPTQMPEDPTPELTPTSYVC